MDPEHYTKVLDAVVSYLITLFRFYAKTVKIFRLFLSYLNTIAKVSNTCIFRLYIPFVPSDSGKF